MEIFGVGPLEFLLILVIALVILGPEDMVGTARKIGQWIYRVLHSPTWRAIIESTNDLRNLPQQIVRDAGLQEAVDEVKKTASEVKSQMSETTREIGTEMAAATRDINGQMRAATSDVAKELGAATATASATALMTNEEIRAATMKRALAEGENGTAAETEIVWPEGNAIGIPMVPMETIVSQPEYGTGESQLSETLTATPEQAPENTENAVLAPDESGEAMSLPGSDGAAAPQGDAEAAAPQDGAAASSAATEETAAPASNPYVTGLETFAQALGLPAVSEYKSAEPRENAVPSAPVNFMPQPSAPEAPTPQLPDGSAVTPGAPEGARREGDDETSILRWDVEAPAPKIPDGSADTPGAPEGVRTEESDEASTPQGGAEASTQRWAAGATPDFEDRMQEHMAQMDAALKKVEQANPSPPSPEEAPARSEENFEI